MGISSKDRKILWSRAGNQCSYPGCLQELTIDVTNDTADLAVTVIGEEAHIRAKSKGGPRYDATCTDVDGHDNLILLCPTHHTSIDANDGLGYPVQRLLRFKHSHEAQKSSRGKLESTLQAYIGDRYASEDMVQFQQIDLRGPSVDDMFVDVPLGMRRDASDASKLVKKISAGAPGDTEWLEQDTGLDVVGATQALLHPAWLGNAVLVGGPGQGKSTILQYICQYHRARRLGKKAYSAEEVSLERANSVSRFPVRIELRNYAQWATKAKMWPSLEEYIIEDIRAHIGAKDFNNEDFALLLTTDAVLIALDGLDEVASLPFRERVVEEVIRMNGRLQSEAMDLVVIVATRPGASLQPLSTNQAFPVLHLQRLTQGLRIQYLRKWCIVSGLSEEASADLQQVFMNSQNIPHINELASYPMQLAILLHLLYRRQLLPQQRTELYSEYLKTFFDREQGENKEPLLSEQRRVVEETHAYIGWYLQSKAEEGDSAGSITRSELKKLLQSYLAGRPKEQELADQIYSALTDRVLCLVERNDAFEFEVQSLREYFAALHIFDNLTPKGRGNSRDDGLNALLERPYWANVCRFFVGMLSRGEIRGLPSNFEIAHNRVDPLPTVRIMAVLILQDRIFDGLTDSEMSKIVEFIFSGPGLVLAEEGVLDPAGSPLRLGEEAGRRHAAAYLKSRALIETDDIVSEYVMKSLRAHIYDGRELSSWWWQQDASIQKWLQGAASLGAFKDLSPQQSERLIELLVQYSEEKYWTAELMIIGNYNEAYEPATRLAIDCLNAGYAELVGDLQPRTEITYVAVCATGVLEGRDNRELQNYIQVDHTQTPRAREMNLPALSQPSGSSMYSNEKVWLEKLEITFRAWGDGWVLRRAISMVPHTIDLLYLTRRANDQLLRAAIQDEAEMRTHKNNAVWWKDRLQSTSMRESALSLIGCLELASTPVLVDLGPTLDEAILDFKPKMYRVVEAALARDRRRRTARLLELSEPLRLRQTSFSGRSLWLIWQIASESTRERLVPLLEERLPELPLSGTFNVASLMEIIRPKRKIKREVFKGSREFIKRSIDERSLTTLSQQLSRMILQNPEDWPPGFAESAAEKLLQSSAKKNSTLTRFAEQNSWFS